MPSATAPDARRGSVSDLLAALDLAGRCWCYTDLGTTAGFSVPPCDDVHVHAVLDGAVRFAGAGGEMLRLEAGSAIIVLSGEAHAIRTSSDSSVATHPLLRAAAAVDVPPTLSLPAAPDGARRDGGIAARVLSGRLRLGCPGEMDRTALPGILHVTLSGNADESGPAALLLRPQALALAGIGPGSAALLTRIAALMLVAALRVDPRCRRMLAPARHDPIAEAVTMIERRPEADWTVASLARAVGMGRSNFAAQFTLAIGRAPMELVVEQRMRQAEALLREGKLKIAEIGGLVGYGSEAAFSRRFSRHFGMTPSRMRDEARLAATLEEARSSPGAPAQSSTPRRLLGGRATAERPRTRPLPQSLSSARPLMMMGATSQEKTGDR